MTAKPAEPARILEIRHQIVWEDDRLVVIERFGEQPPMRWIVADKAAGLALVAERQAMLKAMVAAISPKAAEAVAEARMIDYLGGGTA